MVVTESKEKGGGGGGRSQGWNLEKTDAPTTAASFIRFHFSVSSLGNSITLQYQLPSATLKYSSKVLNCTSAAVQTRNRLISWDPSRHIHFAPLISSVDLPMGTLRGLCTLVNLHMVGLHEMSEGPRRVQSRRERCVLSHGCLSVCAGTVRSCRAYIPCAQERWAFGVIRLCWSFMLLLARHRISVIPLAIVAATSGPQQPVTLFVRLML